MPNKLLRRKNVADIKQNQKEERKSRDLETRNETTRNETWTPPPLLPDPTPQQGWAFRWIRTSMVGKADNTNVSMRFREGWEAVKAEDHPELSVISDHESKFPGCVEVGGLLLCKAPEEMAVQRQAHYENKAQQQMESVDHQYMRENDPRMPVLRPDRKSRTTFGRGGS